MLGNHAFSSGDFKITDELLMSFGEEEDDDFFPNPSLNLDADCSQLTLSPPLSPPLPLPQGIRNINSGSRSGNHSGNHNSRSAAANFSISEEAALSPTPIGRSCQVVQNQGQVPLNHSLLSEAYSLAGLLRRLEEKKKPGSIMPSLLAAPVMSSSITEADFGPVGCPSTSALRPLPLPFSVSSHASSHALSATISDETNRSQQSSRWNQRFQELSEYKNQNGDCNVPYLWPNNRPLSEWVKRQRHQFKLKMEGRHSALTEKRQGMLTGIGFVWNSRASLWDARYQDLLDYFQEFGNVRVTKKTSKHRALSVWLKRQRHAARLFLSGDDTTCMTEDRLQNLVDLGVKITKNN
jgi:hypothetical protein